MWLIIILALIAVISGVLSHYHEKEHEYEVGPLGFLYVMTCVASAFAVIALLLCLVDLKSDLQEDTLNYELSKELVENYVPSEGGDLAPVVAKIVKTNEMLAKHKSYAHNPFIGIYYSKELAEKDFLPVPMSWAEQDAEE